MYCIMHILYIHIKLTVTSVWSCVAPDLFLQEIPRFIVSVFSFKCIHYCSVIAFLSDNAFSTLCNAKPAQILSFLPLRLNDVFLSRL